MRELTGLGLREAKEIIDCVPSFVVSGVSLRRAKEAPAFLEDVGAVVDIRKGLGLRSHRDSAYTHRRGHLPYLSAEATGRGPAGSEERQARGTGTLEIAI